MRTSKQIKNKLNAASKVLFIVILDVLATAGSFFFGLWFRAEFHFSDISYRHLEGYLSFILPWCAITVLVFALFKLYSSIWVYVSASEVFRIAGAYVVLGIVGISIYGFDGTIIPRSSMVIGFLLSFMFTVGIRFSYRMMKMALQKLSHMAHITGIKRVMLIGAGEAGRTLIMEYINSEFINDEVVCVIDDNVSKMHRRLCGVPIVGGRNDIPKAVKRYRIDKIVFAIPSASAATRKEILDICTTTGCEVHTLPGIYQMLNGEISVSKLRKVDPQDLLGRDPVKVNLDELAGFISGKVVLVTGGGGSIGSELCRQIARLKPARLIILDIYENNAYDIQMELRRIHPELDLQVLIGSVRNISRLESIMETWRPELVFHAAAHKHVPLMEDSPNEAIKNNVFGTYNMAKV